MKRLVLCLVLCLSGALVAGEEGNRFQHTVALYKQIGRDGKNLFFSPFSIASAMTMVYTGCGGNTAGELAAALNLKLQPGEAGRSYGGLLKQLSDKDNRLAIANALCLTGGDVAADYKKQLAAQFQAEIFKGDLARINNWAKEKTLGRIPSILKKLDPNSICVLLNAIYFKGAWQKAFDPRWTKEKPFHRIGGSAVSVPMMTQSLRCAYMAGQGFAALRLPYKGEDLAMVILLPNKPDGLQALEKAMTSQLVSTTLKSLQGRHKPKVHLTLPRFRFATGYGLIDAYKSLGVKDAFDMRKADFTGMGLGIGNAAISQIQHKAFVEVNEEGTEAAAVTAVEIAKRAAPARPLVFRADHPFVFLIHHQPTNTILFAGRVMDPTTE